MYALKGRVDGNTIVLNENITMYEGCDVVITILDRSDDSILKKAEKRATMEAAARELAGMWKTHSQDISVDETVRAMRRGRRFDS